MKILELNEALKYFFDYDGFKQGQEEVIRSVLKKENTLAVLPTGSGKSICYQLPALISKGLTVVVSPLISLMIDQVNELTAGGVKQVAALTSLNDFNAHQSILSRIDSYRLIYVSPEILQSKSVIKALDMVEIDLFVVDEAHCISQWGYDFRPDYLKLDKIIERLNCPPVLMLTATATEKVRQDIISELNVTQVNTFVYDIAKDNIILSVERCEDEKEKIQTLLYLLKKFTEPVLIYFSSRKKTEELAGILSHELPHLNTTYYHGGMDNNERILVQQQFMNDQLNIICCTTAFGMGINKANIRLIIHFHLPLDLESYVQEIGRAGRDDKESYSLVLYSEDDLNLARFIIEQQFLTDDKIDSVYYYLDRNRFNLSETDFKKSDFHEQLNIDQSQWENLHYLLVKHGMINAEGLNERFSYLAYNEIVETFNFERKKLKEAQFNEVVQVIRSDSCLMERIYTKFQPQVNKSTRCCTNCNSNLKQWIFNQRVHVNHEMPRDYQSYLSMLFEGD